MLINTSYEIKKSLSISLSFDDGTVKSANVAVGDTVSVFFNKDGARRAIEGVVKRIEADVSKYAKPGCVAENWYMVVDGSATGSAKICKIFVEKILDIDVLKSSDMYNAITSPDGKMKITDFRLNGDWLQLSINHGKRWTNVIKISNKPIVDPEYQDLANKIDAILPKHMNASVREILIIELVKLFVDYKPEDIDLERIKLELQKQGIELDNIEDQVADNKLDITNNKVDITYVKNNYLLAQQDDETYVEDFDGDFDD